MSPKEIIIEVIQSHGPTLIGTATADGLDPELVDAIAVAVLLKVEVHFLAQKLKTAPATLEGDMLMSALKGLSLANAEHERSAFFHELHSRMKAREERNEKREGVKKV